MLSLNVTTSGDKIIIGNLQGFRGNLPGILQGSLTKSIRGIHSVAIHKWLNNTGGAGRKAQITGPSRGFTKKSGETVRFKQQFLGAGDYPVPIRTGNLRRLQRYVEPGQSVDNFTAGPLEAISYNSAEYALAIHEGNGSSRKFGRRPYAEDALRIFNQGNHIAEIFNTDIAAGMRRRNLI